MNLEGSNDWHICKKICPNLPIGGLHLIAVILLLNVFQISAYPSSQQDNTITGTVTDQLYYQKEPEPYPSHLLEWQPRK
jgi:hypothetical protein